MNIISSRAKCQKKNGLVIVSNSLLENFSYWMKIHTFQSQTDMVLIRIITVHWKAMTLFLWKSKNFTWSCNVTWNEAIGLDNTQWPLHTPSPPPPFSFHYHPSLLPIPLGITNNTQATAPRDTRLLHQSPQYLRYSVSLPLQSFVRNEILSCVILLFYHYSVTNFPMLL